MAVVAVVMDQLNTCCVNVPAKINIPVNLFFSPFDLLLTTDEEVGKLQRKYRAVDAYASTLY